MDKTIKLRINFSHKLTKLDIKHISDTLRDSINQYNKTTMNTIELKNIWIAFK